MKTYLYFSKYHLSNIYTQDIFKKEKKMSNKI